MSKKINEIPNKDIETKNETRWFSILKHRAKELQYGSLEVSMRVKKGDVVSMKIEREGETYNINA